MSKVIETDIWENHPEKQGVLRYVGQRRTAEVFAELEAYLKENNVYPDEYFLMTHHFEENYPLFPKMRDMYCFAQWGGSEGIYLEVQLIVNDPEKDGFKHINFVSGKTLEETSEAYDRMQYIAGCIYKAFMGYRQIPARYMITSKKDAVEKITAQRLIAKLSAECEEMLRQRLLHKKEPLADIAGELGLALQVLDAIKHPQTFADLSVDKLRELFETENIMEKLYPLVKHIRDQDTWEIGDIIASKPTLLSEPDEKPKEEELPKDTYYGFTHFSRMSYSDLPREPGFIDEITFGLYVRGDGCVSEACIHWEYLSGKPVYYIRVFDDGLKAAFSQKFLAVAEELKYDGYLSPEQVAGFLISEGFEDKSDKPLKEKDGE